MSSGYTFCQCKCSLWGVIIYQVNQIKSFLHDVLFAGFGIFLGVSEYIFVLSNNRLRLVVDDDACTRNQ